MSNGRQFPRRNEPRAGVRLETVASIRAVLESAGVDFIEENGGGPGVRLRNSSKAGKGA